MIDRRTPILESRLAWGIYFAPIVLVCESVALLAAWLVLNLIGVDRPTLNLIGPLMAVLVVISLVLAGVWVWGARRARLTITNDELALVPHLGRPQSVALSRLVSVDLRRLSGSAARAVVLTDANGKSVQIGIGGWEHEAGILKLIGDAVRRTGANVTPGARDAVG